MPRGDRRYLIAAIGWLILAGQSKQGGAAHHRHHYQQRTANPAPVPKAPDAPSPKATQEPCYPQAEPHITCDGIAAKAAVDQALDADEAAAAVWWQFGVGVATLAAAVAAAVFAWLAAHHTKRGANAASDQLVVAKDTYHAYLEAERPRLIVTLSERRDDAALILFDVIVTNVGAGGCVVVGSFSAWTSFEDRPDTFIGQNCTVAVPAGESKRIDQIVIPRELLAKTPIINGSIRYSGPFIQEPVTAIAQYRFAVFDSPTPMHGNWYMPTVAPPIVSNPGAGQG